MLTVKGLCTDYLGERGEPIRAANDVGFEVPPGRLFTLLGPSGCGKTTTLRSIAGLERPRLGEISVGGDLVYSADKNIFIPPNQRGLGMVFQSYAIWPHMTVFASARRCCWPPESLVASRCAISSRSTVLSTRITRSSSSRREKRLRPTRSGNAAFSNTVICGQMA